MCPDRLDDFSLSVMAAEQLLVFQNVDSFLASKLIQRAQEAGVIDSQSASTALGRLQEFAANGVASPDGYVAKYQELIQQYPPGPDNQRDKNASKLPRNTDVVPMAMSFFSAKMFEEVVMIARHCIVYGLPLRGRNSVVSVLFAGVSAAILTEQWQNARDILSHVADFARVALLPTEQLSVLVHALIGALLEPSDSEVMHCLARRIIEQNMALLQTIAAPLADAAAAVLMTFKEPVERAQSISHQLLIHSGNVAVNERPLVQIYAALHDEADIEKAVRLTNDAEAIAGLVRKSSPLLLGPSALAIAQGVVSYVDKELSTVSSDGSTLREMLNGNSVQRHS